MKVSELTVQTVGEWLGYMVSGGTLSQAEETELSMALTAAKSQAVGYTGLTEEELDDHEDITIAVLGLCNDALTGNRPEGAERSMNRMSEGILALHCRNFL